jgi:hypothetical protein
VCVIEGLDVLVEGLLDAVKTMLHMLTYFKNSPLPRRIAAPPPDTVHYAILRYVPILLKRVIRSLSP